MDILFIKFSKLLSINEKMENILLLLFFSIIKISIIFFFKN